jgi:hypothetical protein
VMSYSEIKGYVDWKRFRNTMLAWSTHKDVVYSVVKVSKAVALHAMEAHGGRGGIAPTRT